MGVSVKVGVEEEVGVIVGGAVWVGVGVIVPVGKVVGVGVCVCVADGLGGGVAHVASAATTAWYAFTIESLATLPSTEA